MLKLNFFISIDENVVLNIDGDETKFFAIGDWGGLPFFPFRTVVQEGVAVRMTKMAQLYSTQFQLALGDNFYFDGVTNEDDKRFFVRHKYYIIKFVLL